MFWNNVRILTLCILTLYLNCSSCNEDGALKSLPFCDDSRISTSSRLLFVSTLDGRLSALDILNGNEKWSIGTGPGGMISSSIHKLELTNNGQLVRMIPSLSGGLYKFDGDEIQPIPVNADKLLEASFRYSEDIIISGGKESRSYGVDMETGNVVYECSMLKCDNLTTKETSGDIIIVKRQTQTVRAVEPRTGLERWNFSVGQHDVKVALDPSADCHSNSGVTSDIEVKVIVPDGLVCAVLKSKPSTVLWEHKFKHPVVSAWKNERGNMKLVDLFAGQNPTFGLPPVLYVGMYNKQLYIQESVIFQRKLIDAMQQPALEDSTDFPTIPWKPVSASEILGISGSNNPVLQITDESKTTAMSVLYASSYVNGNGFYLFITNKEKCQKENLNLTITTYEDPNDNDSIDYKDYSEEPMEEQLIQVIILPFWHWWKEIIVISLSTAIIINVLIQKKLQSWFGSEPSIVHIESKPRNISLESGGAKEQITVKAAPPTPELYSSRYLNDFEPLNVLGKGGFGIVFEAKNKIDDCVYAIKRIPLSNKGDSRERVMREVKALAKLDHQHIVRFFNAWLECPPTGWQEEQDRIWAEKLRTNSSGVTVDLTGHVTPISESKISNYYSRQSYFPSIMNQASNVFNSISNLRDSFMGKMKNMYLRHKDESDSFIVFENSEQSDGSFSNQVEATDSKNCSEDSFIVFEKKSTLPDCSKSQGSLESRKILTQINSCVSKRPTTLDITSSRMFLYIQMQLCRKDSLREWLQQETRHPKEGLIIFDQIVQAVEYVHLQGLIHRDLKPSNIFFSPEGQIKIGDFGLVTAMGIDSTISYHSPLGKRDSGDHTAMVGTHLYMSPEQQTGLQYNYKVDIYSLGLILFELLVQFGTQMERIKALSDIRKFKFPSYFIEKFPEEFKLLSLMLSECPDDRPTTIGIRSRPPLLQLQSDSCGTSEQWHFTLPIRHRDHSFSKSSSQES